jgi:hypothetical protein
VKSDQELIEKAIEAVREVGHRHSLDGQSRELLEYAMAYLRELAIASGGHKASTRKRSSRRYAPAIACSPA